MLSIQFILNILKDSKAVLIIYLLLAVSIIQVVDLFITIFLTNIFGLYLIMGIICSLSLIGLFFSITRIKTLTFIIKDNCNKGFFPGKSFFALTGIYCASLLIFIPGFVSSILGFSLLFPLFSEKSGKMISEKTSTDWHTVYEYMKI